MDLRARIGLLVQAQGAQRASAEMDEVAASTKRVGDATAATGTQHQRAAARSDKFLKSLSGLSLALQRGTLYGAGFGVALAGTGGFLGLKFDAQMEQATVAFDKFLGGPRQARRYLDDLYKLAATTPFEFPQLTAAAQKFLSFGFSARQARSMLSSVADAASGLGKSGAQIDQLVLALGQVRAKGRLQGDELMQLTEFGISQVDIRKQLGLTATEFQKQLQKGAIGADQALAAIQRAMDKRFHGMSKAQSKTFSGQLSTLKDMSNQALGQLAQPLFNWLRDKGLPGLNRAMPAIISAVQGFVRGVGARAPAVIHSLRDAFRSVMDTIRPAAPFLQNVLAPLLKGIAIGVIGSVVGAFKIAVPVLRVFFRILGSIGRAARPFRGVIQAVGVVIGVMFSGEILGAIGRLKALGGVFRVIGGAARLLSRPFLFAGRAIRLAALGIREAWRGALNFLIGAWNRLHFRIPGFKVGPVHFGGTDLGVPKIPLLAQGGIATAAGAAVVGEAGPELLDMPKGARVAPLDKGPIDAGGHGREIIQHIRLDVDGKTLATAVRRVALRDLLASSPA